MVRLRGRSVLAVTKMSQFIYSYTSFINHHFSHQAKVKLIWLILIHNDLKETTSALNGSKHGTKNRKHFCMLPKRFLSSRTQASYFIFRLVYASKYLFKVDKKKRYILFC